MGDMADYYSYGYGGWPTADMLQPDPPRVTRATRWTQRDGTQVAVRDMMPEHIRNVLNMYEQGRLTLPYAWVATFRRELERR